MRKIELMNRLFEMKGGPVPLLLLFFLSACGSMPPVADEPAVIAAMPALSAAAETAEGIILRGSDPRMLSFRAFLTRSGIPASFGIDRMGNLVLSIARDATDRYLIVPYAWEHIDYAERAALTPEDAALAKATAGVPAELELRIPGWEKAYARTVVGTEPRILFKSSTLNLPFGEETLVAFFYSLRDSTLRPGSLAALYHPAFSGIPVTVRVDLFSAEIVFSESAALSPEEFFLWMYTLRAPSEQYDDAFYANLLALKIAKKLYTGIPSFLGGATLFTRSDEIPYDDIRRHLLIAGGVEFSGLAVPYCYVWRGDRFSETTVLLPREQSQPVKALYGASDGAIRSLFSIVLRAADAEAKRQMIEQKLATRNIAPISRFYERTGDQDGWAAVNFTVDPTREAEMMKFFDGELAAIDTTISIGVYRVGTQER